MEEDLLSLPPETKLYKERMIFLVAFFGGPLGGAYMIAENFKVMEQPRRALTTWIVSVAYIVLLLAGSFLLPILNKVPNMAYAIIYPLAANQFVRTYQGPAIKEHFAKGGQFYPASRAVAVAVIGLVIVLAVIVGIMAATGGIS